MHKQKTTMIEVTDDELWNINLGLALLHKSKAIIPSHLAKLALLSQRIYKMGIVVFGWERK